MSKSGFFSFSIGISSLFLSGMKSKSRAKITLKTAFFQKWSRTRNRFNVTIRYVIFSDSSRCFPAENYQDKRLVAIPSKAITNKSYLSAEPVRGSLGDSLGDSLSDACPMLVRFYLWGNLSGTCGVSLSGAISIFSIRQFRLLSCWA